MGFLSLKGIFSNVSVIYIILWREHSNLPLHYPNLTKTIDWHSNWVPKCIFWEEGWGIKFIELIEAIQRLSVILQYYDCKACSGFLQYVGVSPKCFTEFGEFTAIKICDYTKRARTCYLLCKKLRCYHSASKTRHMWVTWSLNLAQFMLQWFIKFPEFNEISAIL